MCHATHPLFLSQSCITSSALGHSPLQSTSFLSARPPGGSAVCFESDNVIFDPIIEVVSTHKYVIRQSSLFEFSALNGKLIVCTMNFDNDDPASAYLKSEIINYAGSDKFNPKNKLSQSALYDLIHAKVRVFKDDNNLAFNLNDITMS